jgi:hypothetical protein
MLHLRFPCGLVWFLTAPDGLPAGLGVSPARGSAHRKEIEIRTHFKLPVRLPMLIAGITVCLLAASGTVAIVRSIPVSYANIPDEGAPSRHRTAISGAEDAHISDQQTRDAVAWVAINRPNRARCTECGVIDSMRQIEHPKDVGGRANVDVKIARAVSGGASNSAIAANAVTGKGYEFTVRFRDGSTTVFNDAGPQTWKLGSRVIVVGHSTASNN